VFVVALEDGNTGIAVEVSGAPLRTKYGAASGILRP
jgi:hypothetical protein